MELDVPLNMDEVNQKVSELKAAGKEATVEDVIYDTILQSFQGYLDEAEEGHYDTAKLVDGELGVYGITDKKTHTVDPFSTDWIEDFKANADAVFAYLADSADEIAKEG
ncbi:hypothetical protein [Lentilactobacillus sp. Marseille-Q4993]|uniref:hypothetical protein n=1 Tax=Lentilactobacillus sp. Marseille-Q4993 TaxID=3039492 RepID=UPI0024BBFAD2|nr:hypothetical protein [Lentilactobacillus sp. Marseille-Q4993]